MMPMTVDPKDRYSVASRPKARASVLFAKGDLLLKYLQSVGTNVRKDPWWARRCPEVPRTVCNEKKIVLHHVLLGALKALQERKRKLRGESRRVQHH